MLEQSYGLNFFLKSPKNKTQNKRLIYIRISVDGVAKESSTKRHWEAARWDQQLERAIGVKEDARELNFFLESLTTKVNAFRTELVNQEKPINAVDLIDYVNGRYKKRNKVLEEFQEHNEEIAELVEIGDKAPGTLERYTTARSHVKEFIRFKYKVDDLPFAALNYEFVKNYNHYLRTVRNCSNNTSLKYVSNFKKIVLRAVAKDIIPKDPFKLFTGKKTKVKRKPLTRPELQRIEEKVFSSARLSVVRDIFVFQCYTGLSYIDAVQLKWDRIKEGNDGSMWIMSDRQKSKSDTDIPLLPKALEIIAKYDKDPLCLERGTVLPLRSNQKMNEYLKEIADLCDIREKLNTHKARRTFASTVTLNNGVSIHVVKEMLGHYSVQQTEEYAITEQESISREMNALKEKLDPVKKVKEDEVGDDLKMILLQFKKDFEDFRKSQSK
ncbi:site-specific integrase [Chryseobacterium sp.]|uniref:site-specific integrase n=1 Tax=Chryseobacterium sp. TaxID=1871047 RepID=UPI0031E30BB1